ncbi:FMN-binding protein [Candidatus Falkowbacteria bacterium]|nr:FMN-binding protein [Candidatus Falkowbacteria bacterium]
MLRKFFLSFSLILIFTFYILFQRGRAEDGDIILPPVDKNRQLILTPGTPSDTSTEPPSPESQTSKSNFLRTLKDGEFIGNIMDAYYGNVQVKAIVQGGKIIDVQFLDYPSDRKKSIEINRRATPLLKTEAIQAQNAQVDIVSGATLTSQAFQESLADALSQAKN